MNVIKACNDCMIDTKDRSFWLYEGMNKVYFEYHTKR